MLVVPAWSQGLQPTAPVAPAAGSDAKSYVEYGKSLGQTKDYNGAIAAFTQAITLDPKFAPAYYFRGLGYALQQKTDEAIANYTHAIQLDPTFKDAFYNRGGLEGQQGNFDAADKDFTAVIALDPKYAPAYYNRGHVEYFQGNLDGAFDQINQGLALDPNSSLCYYIRGLIRHAQGHREDATADFQKSVGLNFTSAAYWIWITEMEGGDKVGARKDLLDALGRPETFKPDDWPSQIGNFLLEKITRDQLMAKAKTDSASETDDRLCEAWFYSGMYSLLNSDPKEARECFTQAIATGAKGSEEYIEANRQLAALPAQ
jgi:tetratricopeptide (TPR) repeat protein